jgi:hypothetical protein
MEEWINGSGEWGDLDDPRRKSVVMPKMYQGADRERPGMEQDGYIPAREAAAKGTSRPYHGKMPFMWRVCAAYNRIICAVMQRWY